MRFSNFLWGVVFIVIGVILGMNALDITDINIFFDGWWTLFIIVPSFINLFKEDDKTASVIWLLVGIALLLACNDYISFDIIWKLALPVILVVIGISIMFKDRVSKEVIKKIKEKDEDDDKTICATFKEEVVKADKKATNVDLEAIFGSIRYDMRETEIKKDMVIKTSAIFGSIKIIVPEGVNVKMKSSGLFKDSINKVKDTDSKNTIYIDSFTLFGSVITNVK